ncbi:MAG: cupin domain-containing protein [Sandaracinaceae bacterium]
MTVSDCSRRAGLERTGVTLARLSPGKAAFPVHRHHAEEDWVYVLEGSVEVRLGDVVREVGPGSFVAFVPGGPAHQLHNRSDADVVYLMGGESSAVEIVDFPELGKRSLRMNDFYASTIVPLAADD